MAEDFSDEHTPSATLLTVAANAIATNDELITVSCEPSDDITFAVGTPITIDSNGVRGDRRSFKAVRVWDSYQLVTRKTEVTCAVSSTVAAKTTAALLIPVTVLGIAQPSVSLFCPHNFNTSGLEVDIEELAACVPTLTTNGGTRVVVIGGTGPTCPIPSFCAGETSVSIGGINVPTDVSINGRRLEFTTPTIAEMKAKIASFSFGHYYSFSITTAVGSHGVLEGRVALGPGAPVSQTDSTQLRCGTPEGHSLCPIAPVDASGSYYTDRCLEFRNPSVDSSWNESATASLFAYGIPPSCRQCPEGCLCPGGDRCHATEGNFLAGESLGDASTPIRCAFPATIRCAAYSPALGRTMCGVGYDGPGCGMCSDGYYKDRSVCNECEVTGTTDAIVLPSLANALAVVMVFPTLLAMKMLSIFLSIVAERKLAGDDAPPMMSFKEVGVEAVMQTARFVVASVQSVQLIATVNAAAVPIVSSEVLRVTSTILGAFLFDPPLVHPECAGKAIGIDIGFVVEYAVMIGALVACAIDINAMVRWLRIEQLCFGWPCCATAGVAVKLRAMFYTRITPFLRYGVLSLMSLGYVPIVKVALNVIACQESSTLAGYALISDPTVACFTSEHTAIFVLAIIVIAVVGVAWPFAWAVFFTRTFVMPNEKDSQEDQAENGVVNAEGVVPEGGKVGGNGGGAADEASSSSSSSSESSSSSSESDNEDSSSSSSSLSDLTSSSDDDDDAAHGHAEAEAGDGDADGAIADVADDAFSLEKRALALDVLTEMGCRCAQLRSTQRVQGRLYARGGRSRAYAAFADTPMEPQYYWLIVLRLYLSFLLSAANAFLSSPTATIPQGVALFCITVTALFFYTVAVLAQCPYHRSDRWNVAKTIAIFILTSASSAVNLCITLREGGKTWAEPLINIGANFTAFALLFALVFVLIAFLLARAIGCFKLIGCKCEQCESPTTSSRAAEEIGLEMLVLGKNLNPRFRAQAAEEEVVSDSISSETVSDEADVPLPRRASKPVPRLVTWRKRRAEAATLADALFGSDGEGRAETQAAIDAAVSAIFHTYLSESKTMKPLTAMKMMRTESEGTRLADSFEAQSALLTSAREASGDDTGTTKQGFLEALRVIAAKDPNGAVVEWLMLEVEKYENEVMKLVTSDGFLYNGPETGGISQKAHRNEILRMRLSNELSHNVWIQPFGAITGDWHRKLWYIIQDLIRATEQTDDGDKWYYYGDPTAAPHGPFPLSKLREWHLGGHFTDDQEVYQGFEGPKHRLKTALSGGAVRVLSAAVRAPAIDTADAWYYDRYPNDANLEPHGPFSLSQMRAWHRGGHFDDDKLVRHGRAGPLVKLGGVLMPEAEAGGSSSSSDELSSLSSSEGEEAAAVGHPRGWSATHSAEHDRTYYTNNHTSATQWERPTLPAPPEGWSVHEHGDSQYWQRAVGGGASQWHHPHDAAPAPVVQHRVNAFV